MTRLRALLLLSAATVAAVAVGQQRSGTPPVDNYGNVAVGTTATVIPAFPSPSRHGIALFNNGTATIFCGWDSSVTATNGFPVLAQSAASFQQPYWPAGQVLPAAMGTLYCIAAAAQTSPADTRWMEL